MPSPVPLSPQWTESLVSKSGFDHYHWWVWRRQLFEAGADGAVPAKWVWAVRAQDAGEHHVNHREIVSAIRDMPLLESVPPVTIRECRKLLTCPEDAHISRRMADHIMQCVVYGEVLY